MTVLSLWAATTIVLPLPNFLRFSTIRRSLLASSDEVASSRKSICRHQVSPPTGKYSEHGGRVFMLSGCAGGYMSITPVSIPRGLSISIFLLTFFPNPTVYVRVTHR